MGDGFSLRPVWSVITKRWAYTCASFLCIIVIALLAASCGTSWFAYSTRGYVQLYLQNSTTETTQNFEYYVYYEVYEYFLHLDSKITLGGYEFSKSCDYADGVCENLVNTYYNVLALNPPQGICTPQECVQVAAPNWDLKEYQPSYGAMFAFTLASILLALFLGIIIQVICWTYDRWSPIVTLVLLIIAIVSCVVLLIFLLINWTIFFGHDSFVRSSLDVEKDWCAGGDSRDKEDSANVLCTWNGDVLYSSTISRYERFYNLNWRQQNPNWGPHTAWVLSTIAFGLVGFVFLLIVGWRPAIKF